MSCMLDFEASSLKIFFCSQGSKQKILIEILEKYSEMDMKKLALSLDVPLEKLKNISDGHDFLVGEQADCLAQLFLMFLGKHFFRDCTLTRHFS